MSEFLKNLSTEYKNYINNNKGLIESEKKSIPNKNELNHFIEKHNINNKKIYNEYETIVMYLN